MSFLIFEATNFQSNFDEWLESFGQQIVSAHSVTEWNFILTHTHTYVLYVLQDLIEFFALGQSSSNCMCIKGKVWASKAFRFFLLRIHFAFIRQICCWREKENGGRVEISLKWFPFVGLDHACTVQSNQNSLYSPFIAVRLQNGLYLFDTKEKNAP